jgi:hypothetical protein
MPNIQVLARKACQSSELDRVMALGRRRLAANAVARARACICSLALQGCAREIHSFLGALTRSPLRFSAVLEIEKTRFSAVLEIEQPFSRLLLVNLRMRTLHRMTFTYEHMH